jgi:hypothetical protein
VITPIGKARGEGNCSGATRGGKEACGCAVKLTHTIVVSRIHTSVVRVRTETGSKAEAAGRVGTTPRSRSQTTAAVKPDLVRRQITLLSGEACPTPGDTAPAVPPRNVTARAGAGEAGVSRGRSTETALPLRTGRAER